MNNFKKIRVLEKPFPAFCTENVNRMNDMESQTVLKKQCFWLTLQGTSAGRITGWRPALYLQADNKEARRFFLPFLS